MGWFRTVHAGWGTSVGDPFIDMLQSRAKKDPKNFGYEVVDDNPGSMQLGLKGMVGKDRKGK